MEPQERSKGANGKPQAAQRTPKGAKSGRKKRPWVPGARSKETRKEKNRDESGHGSKNANSKKKHRKQLENVGFLTVEWAEGMQKRRKKEKTPPQKQNQNQPQLLAQLQLRAPPAAVIGDPSSSASLRPRRFLCLLRLFSGRVGCTAQHANVCGGVGRASHAKIDQRRLQAVQQARIVEASEAPEPTLGSDPRTGEARSVEQVGCLTEGTLHGQEEVAVSPVARSRLWRELRHPDAGHGGETLPELGI